ncbi:LytR family transcriptional regulator [Macrococcus brunensis]|uniref:LytR family transcriptional regulator n=1 Tax=Macrococcus brunensis TaxID=198483 RepID=A0A4R6BAM6_9STAP|nr:LCP family protein [Macrococcus brunensis]TDL93355.1 LytR family transcriptional regulator [Macrococcus brunensis]
MKKPMKIILILLSLCLIIAPSTYAAILYFQAKNAVDKSFTDNTSQSSLRDGAVNPAMNHVSILFLGIDDSLTRRRDGQTMEKARTDAMILGTFNRDKQQIRLVSIPRDTLSYIPSVGYYDKITHAHADGGPESSMQAVETLFDVPVDYYARINMQAFVDIIDELGGIYFKVPFDLNEPTKNDIGRIKVKKGYQKINGDQALALVRSRHVDTDLGRGKRQAEMIEAIIKKAKQTDSLDKIDELVNIVGNNAKHNLSFNDITSLATTYSKDSVKFEREQLSGADYMHNGVYYFNPDFSDVAKTASILRKDLGLPAQSRKELLSYKVTQLYGDLIPLEPMTISKIDKAYQAQFGHKEQEKKETTQEQTTTEAPATETPAPITEAPVPQTEAPTTEPPYVPTTEVATTEAVPHYVPSTTESPFFSPDHSSLQNY